MTTETRIESQYIRDYTKCLDQNVSNIRNALQDPNANIENARILLKHHADECAELQKRITGTLRVLEDYEQYLDMKTAVTGIQHSIRNLQSGLPA